MADPTVDPMAAALMQSSNFVNPSYATPDQKRQLYMYADQMLRPQPVNNAAQGFAEP